MKVKGFSLLELMIVISIMALFITFTYSNYSDSLTRARRLDGQTALIDLANRMELYYAKHHSYQGATLGLSSETDVLSTNHSQQNWYILVISQQTDDEFSLNAIPRGAQAKNDKACQTLSFNSLGKKAILAGPSGMPSAKTERCWSF